ncbi:hypothetical protein E2986_12094 [Frieseomelitta varia]|uniref:Uncharacterized protein n=1 Tax=Frieseomelitta varia TaxID=561572 RepID=A0A833W2E1_9HYME|nr:hypothetical protein E2986_12094 [Frieseomelitta varia]
MFQCCNIAIDRTAKPVVEHIGLVSAVRGLLKQKRYLITRRFDFNVEKQLDGFRVRVESLSDFYVIVADAGLRQRWSDEAEESDQSHPQLRKRL